MKKIVSLKQYASLNPDSCKIVDSVRLGNANKSIKMVVKNSAVERRAAIISASKIMLTK